ncbi:MAG: PH domain-containing protein [Halodesulfurarchaeum sp.]
MKLHPFTIPIRGGNRALGLGVVGFVLGSVGGSALAARGIIPVGGPYVAIPLAALFGLVALGYEVAYHRRFRYELTGDTLDIESGVLSRREREIPLRRIQNVDVTRSLVPRLLGIAAVNIETAGGGSTEAQLKFVTLAEARRLQEEIQRRKRGASEQATEGAETPEPTRDLLFELDDRDLILYSVLSFDPRILSVLFLVVPTGLPAITSDLGELGTSLLLAFGIFGALLAAAGIWAMSAFTRFVQFYGFRLHRVEDELRYERGLIQRYDGSIPLEKVQTLTVEENALMRHFGFASLSVETAGYAPGSMPSRGSEAAIPLAKRETLIELAGTIEPFEMPQFERPPAIARRRYVMRYGLLVTAIVAVAYGVSVFVMPYPWFVLVGLYLLIPLAAQKKWAHRGWALGEGYAFTRNGFWRRRIHVVPDFRVQTVIESRTVFQRRWGLGTLTIDTASSRSLVTSDAAAVDVEGETAVSLRDTVADRLQDALRGPTGRSQAPAD